MKRLMMGMSVALASLLATSAMGEGVEYGVRIASGSGFARDSTLDSDTSIFPFAVGPAVRFNTPVLQLEANLLYWQTTFDSELETIDTEIAVPIIARLKLPVVPTVLNLQLGAGIEPRVHLGTTVEGNDFSGPDRELVMYLPISVAGDLNLGPLGLNLEIRYEYQLNERIKGDDSRVDYLTFFGGIFF